MSIKESAALTMCSGMLGNCYLLAEVTEGMILDTLAKFKHEKWFKQEIKKYLNTSFSDLHSIIINNINGSLTNADYMREVADTIYNILKQDIFKLRNAVSLELNKRKVEQADTLTDMVTIDIMYQCIKVEYDDVIQYMKTIFNACYDSWYYPIKCKSPAYWWNKGMQTFAAKHLKDTIDITNTPNIQNGVAVIQKKMHSVEIADAIRQEASKYADEGVGRDIYQKALQTLGRI